MAKTFEGVIKARIVEARFAVAGKISGVSKRTGDVVKKWGLIASLDRKILQTELDKQLADFEKVRADFEIFNQKNPDPQAPIDKYLKVEKQASLNASVKDVELAKTKLDQADLFSPVDGIILDDSNIVSGLYITPAGSAVKIIDASSYYFEIEIEQKNLGYFENPREATIKIDDLDITLKSQTSQIFSDGRKFTVKIPITGIQNILIGQNGKASF